MSQILFIPGLLSDARVWAAQIKALGGRAMTRVLSLLDTDTLPAMAQAGLRCFDGPFVIVGHSMGGRVALEMVREAPGRIRALVLADTAAGPIRDGEVAARQELVDLANQYGMSALADRWLPPMVHPDRAADSVWMAPLKAMVERVTPVQHERQIRAMLARPDARDVLPGIRCPTLVVVGREDQWSPLAQHEDIARAIPGARLEVIEHAGHFAPVEQPAELTRVLVAWLQDAGLLSRLEMTKSPAR